MGWRRSGCASRRQPITPRPGRYAPRRSASSGLPSSGTRAGWPVKQRTLFSRDSLAVGVLGANPAAGEAFLLLLLLPDRGRDGLGQAVGAGVAVRVRPRRGAAGQEGVGEV